MKKLGLILVGALILLSSCSKDPQTILEPDTFIPSEITVGDNGSIFPCGDDVILSRNAAEDLFAQLSWSSTDFGYDAAITYNLQIASAEVNNDEPVYTTVVTTSETTCEISVKDFNTWLINCGAKKGYANKMLIRVSASISSNYRAVCSKDYAFTAYIFSNDPDRLYFVSANKPVEFTSESIACPDFNGEYNGFVNIPDAVNGIWLVEDSHPDVKWGLSSPTEQGTKLTLVKESEGGKAIMPGAFGTGDIDASFTDNGYYRIKVILKEDVKTFELWRFWGGFNVNGQRNMNYKWWANSMSKQSRKNKNGTGAALIYDPITRLWKSETVYIPAEQTDNVALPAPGNGKRWEFKLRANDAWGPAIEAGGTSSDHVDADGVQSGILGIKPLGGNAGNIRFNGSEGWYHFEVNLSEKPYSYRLVPDKVPEE